MNPLPIVLVATGLVGGTGLLALLLARTTRAAASVAVSGAVVGGVLGLWAAVSVLSGAQTSLLTAHWAVPGGQLVFGLDPLSAFFLVPLSVLGALCAVYGRSYLGPRAVQAAELNLLIATMMLVLVAQHALLFLVAWEAMTLAAYVLITTHHDEAEVRRAGWVYLIASHAGVTVLFALFLAMSSLSGGALDFASFGAAWHGSSTGAAAILALAVLGFGFKAGVVGLHVWLPEAHAAAPSHVSALMSAVLIKLGLYGILRTTLIVSPGAWFGAALMALGALGAILGIALALTQRDIKRILAYSSVENIGIILIGLGLGFWARAHGDAQLAALGFAGGLLHIWNHAAMKGLMFLGAGSVLHSTGTKNAEQLGGLLRRMRWTGRAMILGAVAMAGLPPLNGFTGEWLIYRGLTQLGISHASPSNLGGMGSAAAIALVGGLATLCFVRLISIVFLGEPRSEGAEHAHESPAAMTIPLGILAGVCVLVALFAPVVVVAQTSVVVELSGASGLDTALAADLLSPLVVVNLLLFLAILGGLFVATRRAAKAPVSDTWGCGYAAPTARMQYTARGFSELLTTRALPRWIRSKMHIAAPVGNFPAQASFASETVDPLTSRFYERLLNLAGDQFSRLRFLQQGNLHIYLLYVFAMVVGGLAWSSVRDWLAW